MKSFSPTIGRMFLVAVASLFAATVMGEEYVWTGAAGDGKWITPGNWVVSEENESGEVSWETPKTYPGQKVGDGTYDYDPSTVRFTNSVELVDLSDAEGVKKTYYFTQNQPIKFSENITVKFKNGTFRNLIDNKNDRFKIGAAGTTLIFENFNFYPVTVSGSDVGDVDGSKVAPASSTTVIFEGSNDSSKFRFSGDNYFTLHIRNGTLKTMSLASPAKITLWVSNAVWTVAGATSGVGEKVYFRDEPHDSPEYKKESQITCGSSNGMLLKGEYDIVLLKEGRKDAYLKARNHPTNGNLPSVAVTFKIDVTNWNKVDKIPLVTFLGSTSSFDHTAVMETKLKNTTLVAIANGRDVTKRRNARLEWDSSKNTLYYVQDKPSDGMKVIVR